MRSSKCRAVARRPPRLAAALTLAALLASLGGCGGNGHKRVPAAALPAALSYLPRDVGAVAVVETDPHRGALKQLDRLGSRFQGWKALKRRLVVEIEKQGLDFNREIQPQLGNPFALGFTGDGDRMGAIRVKDAGALERVFATRVDAGTARRLDDYKGSPVFEQNAAASGALRYAAITERELVVADSQRVLKDAIDAAAGEENIAAQREFTTALEALGRAPLVRAVGDVQRLLASADAQAVEARRIPWIKALGSFTAVARIAARGLVIDFRMKSDRAKITANDLPIASGKAAPFLHDLNAPATVGVRNPDRLVRFTERLLQATAPDQFALYAAGLGQLRTFVGVDLHKDVLSKVTNLSVAFGPGAAITFEGKLVAGSAPGVSSSLARAQPFIQDALSQLLLGTTRRRGTSLGRIGVRNGMLVGSIGFSRLPKAVQGERLKGAVGALSARSSPARTGQVIGLLPGVPVELGAILSRLGDLTLAVRAQTGELTAVALVRARK